MKTELNAVVCTSLLLSACGTSEKEKQSPNIVYILADDLGYGDLSCYGQARFSTPNIDRLSVEGIRFTQHYAGCTVSAPSRSCLMTGLHTGHTPIRGNKNWDPEGNWPLPAGTYTIGNMLRARGYATGAFGKWGLGYINTEGDPQKQGFDEFYGYNCQTLAHNYYPDHLWHNHEKICLHENDNGNRGAYSPDLIHKAALEFIRNNKDKPFFLFYPTTIPHAELFVKEEYIGKYRGKLLPEKSFKGVDDGPSFRLGGYGSQQESHAAFAAMVKQLDDYVGEILTELKNLGLENNTIVMFASDNGPHLEGGADPDYFNSNGDFKGYKRDMYEGGIRTAFIAKWPGHIRAGAQSDHVSAFWDVLPTFAEITGAEIPDGIDGISFLPALFGKEQKNHKYLYWEFHEQGGKAAIRMDKWKAVILNVDDPAKSRTELFDLSVDLSEKNDLASSNPEIVKNMEEMIREAHTPSDVFPYAFESK